MKKLSAMWMDHREQINKAFDDAIFFAVGWSKDLFSETGKTSIFLLNSFKLIWARPYRLGEFMNHMEFIGNRSVIIIALTGVFTGLAMSYQIYLGFKLVNATNLVGPTVALGIARELGPVLTGLLVAARAGGAMAARLGTMRVSEQIDALEVMGIDPKQFLVAPRIAAAIVSLPLLCAIFDFIAMMGSYLLCTKVLGLDSAIFWDKIGLWLNPRDIYEGLVKAAFFGLIFATVCCYRGFNASGGAKGVGEATNQGVVNSMVLIIIFNFIISNFIHMYYVLVGIK